ncbi:Ferredoxin, 2Fe-2S [Pontiella desulfatans]|uniref:Ferredoxin, 2Fe-2S n=1 Tax=Pontiella desulfatans TaxID=2750659 RepID=A0A6C2UDU1_PONDE|nr:(2Fe-2S) ferredoxin domain-containing protein [Pontiella desulfatans]VGO17534.1 Ferredoxin, 2Fe-2S [Pontiella desulfatans]
MKKSSTPYQAHLFVCTKSRGGERKSCGDGDNPALKDVLKDEVKKRGWKPVVRVSESSCLGVCDAGPNIMIYPQKIWFSEVTHADVPGILELVGSLVTEPA